MSASHPAASDKTSAATLTQGLTPRPRSAYLRWNPAASPFSSSFSFPAGGRKTQSLASRSVFHFPVCASVGCPVQTAFGRQTGETKNKDPRVVFLTLRSLKSVVKKSTLEAAAASLDAKTRPKKKKKRRTFDSARINASFLAAVRRGLVLG